MQVAPAWVCGDADGNGSGPDIADLVYLVDYMFGQPAGPPPVEFQAADVNGDSALDIADLLNLVEYQFNSGPAPTCGL